METHSKELLSLSFGIYRQNKHYNTRSSINTHILDYAMGQSLLIGIWRRRASKWDTTCHMVTRVWLSCPRSQWAEVRTHWLRVLSFRLTDYNSNAHNQTEQLCRTLDQLIDQDYCLLNKDSSALEDPTFDN